MQKIVLLSAFIIASFTTRAQRYADMSIVLNEPVTGDSVITDEQFTIRANIKNNGPDTLRSGDSLAFELLFDSSAITFNFGSGALPYVILTGKELVPGDSADMGFMFTLSNGWTLGNTEICVGVYHLNTVDSLHDTMMTDNRNCAIITVDRDRTSVTKIGTLNNVQVYPNPSNGMANFDIRIPQPAIVQITISDIMGKTVIHHNKQLQNTSEETIGVSTTQLTPGVYFYTITAGNEQARGKLEIR